MPDDTKTRRPKAAVAQEPEIRPVAGWTPARIDLAKRRADAGDLSLAADLWERVMGDERALGPLQALVSVCSLPLTFESVTSPKDPEADPLVEALDADWWRIYPEELQGEIIRWAMGLGVALVHTSDHVQDDSGRLLPVKDVWHPRHLRWDGRERTWKVKTAASAMGVAFEPGDGEWELFTPYGRKRPWAKAPWYGLGLLWLVSQQAKVDWADWNDCHGKPFRVASNAKPESVGLASDLDAQALCDKIAALVRGGSIVLPDGYDLKLVEAASKNWESFVKIVDEVWPKAVAIALTGGNLNTQVEGGSYAAAAVHQSVEQSRIRTVAAVLDTTTREQGLVWWTEYNYGPDQRKNTPWPKHDTRPTKDQQAEATRLSALGTAVQALSAASVPLDMVKLAELGVPVDLVKASQLTPAPIYKYHFDYGIIDKNEARARIGYEPKPDGNKPALPLVMPGGGELSADLDGVREISDGITELERQTPDALGDGGEYVDGLVDNAINGGAKRLRTDVRHLKALVDSAKSLEDLRGKVVEQFSKMDPADFADVVERVEVLAAMAGRFSAVEET